MMLSHVRDCLCVPGAKCTLPEGACAGKPSPEVLAILEEGKKFSVDELSAAMLSIAKDAETRSPTLHGKVEMWLGSTAAQLTTTCTSRCNCLTPDRTQCPTPRPTDCYFEGA